MQEGRIYIEKIKWPVLSDPVRGTPSGYKAGLDLALAKGLWLRESGTYVKITEAGAALL